MRNVRRGNYSTKRLSSVFAMCVLAALIALAFMPLSAQAGTKIGKSGKTVKKPAKVRLTSVKVTSVNESNWQAKFIIKYKKAKSAKKYQIYLKTNNGKFSKIKTTNKTKIIYKYYSDLEEAFCVKVRAINGKAKGKFSNSKKVKIPGQVQNVKVNVYKQKIKATWNKTKYANRYKVYVKINKGKYKLLKTVKSNSCTFTGGKGKKYYIKVKAFNGSSPSIFSEQVSKMTQKYNYVVKIIGGKAYADGCDSNVFYVKTNNPNGNSFDICINDTKGQNNISCFSSELDFLDVNFKGYYNNGMCKVQGGYLIDLQLNSPGKCKMSIIERADKTNSYRVPVGSITAYDYDKEENAWMDKVIKKVTNSKMTGEQKMTAIANYLKKNGKYPYNYIDSEGNNYTLSLLSRAGKQYWELMEYDSGTSPDILTKFGDKIKYPVRSMFDDYELLIYN